MVATSQLERIAGLVERLQPLGGKERGMRIEAAEWNTLVDAFLGVLEIDRRQEHAGQSFVEDRFAPREHEHPGEVDVSWLDADLQAGLAQRDGAVGTRAVLAEMEQKVRALGAEVARLTAVVEEQQALIDRAAVDDLARGKRLTDFEGRFAGIENLRTLVTTVSGEVGGLKENVATVLELRTSLSDVTGVPIDVAALRQQVRDLETLRENLRGADNRLLRLRDFELKIEELEDALGLGSGLPGRINAAAAEVETRLSARIDERTEGTRADLIAEQTEATNALRAEVATARADLEAGATTRVGEAEGRITADLDAKLATREQVQREELLSATRATIDERLVGLPDLIGTTVAGLRDELAGTLRAELADRLREEVGPVIADLARSVETRLVAAEDKVAGLDDRIGERVNVAVARERQTLVAELDATVDERVSRLREQIRADLDERVRNATDEVVRGLDERIDVAVERRVGDIDGRVRRAVGDATGDLGEVVRTEVRGQIDGLQLTTRLENLDRAVATSREDSRRLERDVIRIRERLG